MKQFELAAIKPKDKKSDKYSSQLYRFMKDRSYIRRVFWYRKSSCSSEKIVEFDEIKDAKNVILSHVFLFNNLDDRSGSRLSNIIRYGKGYKQTGCYCMWDKDDFVEITDWFWENYERYGRCLWDQAHYLHMMDDDGRFTKINRNSIRCNWCGTHLRREVKTVRTRGKSMWSSQRMDLWHKEEPLTHK